MTRKRLFTTLAAGLLVMAAAGSAQAVQADFILDPGAEACIDTPIYQFQVAAVGNATVEGVPITFRLRKVGVPGAIGGAETTTLFNRALFSNTSPSLFPGQFRFCAANNGGPRTKFQVILNGQ